MKKQNLELKDLEAKQAGTVAGGFGGTTAGDLGSFLRRLGNSVLQDSVWVRWRPF